MQLAFCLLQLISLMFALSKCMETTLPVKKVCAVPTPPRTPTTTTTLSPKITYTGIHERCRFYVAVRVGKGQQTIDLAMDTGGIWSFSLIKPSMYQPTGDAKLTQDVKYGACPAKIHFFNERLQFVHTPTVVEYWFGGIWPEDSCGELESIGGILGLATAGSPSSVSFIKQIYDQLEQKLFAIWISNKGDGKLSLGRSLPTCYDQFYKVEVDTVNKLMGNQNTHSWQVKGKVMMCFTDIQTSKFYPDVNILLDTGGAFISLRHDMAKDITNIIQQQYRGFELGDMLYDEKVRKLLPTFTIEFNAKGSSAIFSLAPDDYMFDHGKAIRIGIYGIKKSRSHMTLGAKFFEKYYTEFNLVDGKDHSVMIAAKKNKC